MKHLSTLSALTAFVLATAISGQAQASRTWISGVGDDANPCSRTAPCKTFAGAISKTAAGGEIDALDPGGFGGLTITKSITIDGGLGQVASVLVSGTNGFTIAAASNDVVTIRNIRFQGLLGNGGTPASAGLNGISVQSARQVHIEHCEIDGFASNGIQIAPNGSSAPNVQVTIDDTRVENSNGNGVTAYGSSAANQATVNLSDSRLLSNSKGISAGNWTQVNVVGSVITGNVVGASLASPGSTSVMTIRDTQITNNSSQGVRVVGGAGPTITAVAYLSGVTTQGNGTAISVGSGADVRSFKNNSITEGSVTVTAVAQQ